MLPAAVEGRAVASVDAAIANAKKMINHPAPAQSSSSIRGLWFWTTGRLSSDGCVLWDTQAINTNHSMLQWSQHSRELILTTGGLYRVSFAAFTTAAVSLELHLNGSAGITPISSNRAF